MNKDRGIFANIQNNSISEVLWYQEKYQIKYEIYTVNPNRTLSIGVLVIPSE